MAAGCCQACGHQGGLKPAQPAQEQGHSLCWGRIPFLHHRTVSLTPSETHLSHRGPSSPPAHQGYSQQPVPPCRQAVSTVPLHSCSDSPPQPWLPSFGPCLIFHWDLAGPTHRPSSNKPPAPSGLSAAHAVYSAGFRAAGHGQPWALLPAAWFTLAQPCSIWGALTLPLLG